MDEVARSLKMDPMEFRRIQRREARRSDDR